VIKIDPDVVLEGRGVRLEPMRLEHEAELAAAAADGELWTLRVTSVPEPGQTRSYIETALADKARGVRVPWVVRELATSRVVGSTSYHDIIPTASRVEIGYTWYALSRQRTFVNTACKLRLMEHAFDTLGCKVVGWRTDNLNSRSQAAIERLGAKKDGVLRHHMMRRDGTVRDTVMYSMTVDEWRDGVRDRLLARLSLPS
jgi:N-acetyltransferase